MQSSKKLLLALCSIAFILLFFKTDFYENWIQDRIITPLTQIPEEMSYLDVEERKPFRWGSSYTVSRNIAKYLEGIHKANEAIILLPPKAYIDSNHIDFVVPEPVIFYYYTGLHAKWANSPDVMSCNFALTNEGSNLRVIPVDREKLQKLLSVYLKYKIHL